MLVRTRTPLGTTGRSPPMAEQAFLPHFTPRLNQAARNSGQKVQLGLRGGQVGEGSALSTP